MVVKELLAMADQALSSVHGQESLKESYHLLSHVLNQSRSYILTHQEQTVLDEQVNHFNELLMKRNNHCPLAYLTNQIGFMSYEFYVEEGVLIPRADSEIMIEQLMKQDGKSEVLDLCCGSGVLGITYALYFKDAKVVLSDLSDKCIDVTRKNICRHGVEDRAKVVKGNLFDSIGQRKFDLIISNPPYIKTMEISTLMETVRDHEPVLALDGGEDGLKFYRKIIAEAPEHLKENGVLALEIGINQKEDVISLLKQHHFRNIHSFCDYNKIDRIIIAYY